MRSRGSINIHTSTLGQIRSLQPTFEPTIWTSEGPHGDLGVSWQASSWDSLTASAYGYIIIVTPVTMLLMERLAAFSRFV